MQPTVTIPHRRKVNKKKSVAISAVMTRDEKYFDAIFNGGSITSTPATVQVFAPAQGNAINQRIGDKAVITRLWFKFRLTAGDTTNTIRLILFRFKPNNSASGFPLSPSRILDAGPTGSVDPWSPISYQNRDQFVILKDMLVPLVAAASNGVQIFDWSMGQPIMASVFSTAATTCSNGLHVVYVSDSTGLPDPYMNGLCRVFFSDT